MIMSELAASWKLRSTAAASGEEGLAELQDAAGGADPYDVVLLDHHMPGMRGDEVLSAICADPALAGLPVIFLTSVDYSPSTSLLSKSLSVCLTKPVKSSDLLDMLRAALTDRFEPATPPLATLAPPVCDEPENEAVGLSAGEAALEVLIAEDVGVGQLVMRQIMETARLNAKIVGNGKLAVAAHRLHCPKVILMDLSMPEMDGIEATKQIRMVEEGTGHRTPIIGVTAHALRGDREECLAAGMDDYVTKPISPDHLIATIERWMFQAAV